MDLFKYSPQNESIQEAVCLSCELKFSKPLIIEERGNFSSCARFSEIEAVFCFLGDDKSKVSNGGLYHFDICRVRFVLVGGSRLPFFCNLIEHFFKSGAALNELIPARFMDAKVPNDFIECRTGRLLSSPDVSSGKDFQR